MLRLTTAALLLALCGCAADTTPIIDREGPSSIPAGPADTVSRPGFARCRVAKGEEGFARADTLRCELSDPTYIESASLEVRGRSGYLFGGRLDMAPLEHPFRPDQYPLALAVQVTLRDLPGLDHATLHLERTVESPEAWSSFQLVTLPFDLWSVAVESRVTSASIEFDPYDLTLTDARFSDGPTRRISNAGATLGPTEKRTFVFAATTGPLRGSLAVRSGSRTPFEIPASGEYLAMLDGLVPAASVPPLSADGPDLVSCTRDAAMRVTCTVPVREGITIGRAEVVVAGQAHAIPTDGIPVEIGEVVAQPIEARAIDVAGIAGLPLTVDPVTLLATSRPASFSGPLDLSSGSAKLVLPFDLLHVEWLRRDLVEQAFFDAPIPAAFPLRYTWNGRLDLREIASAPVAEGHTHGWFAVPVGARSLAGRTAIVASNGAFTEGTVTLEQGGRYYVTTRGIEPAREIVSGAELARCFIATNAMRCSVADGPAFRSARASYQFLSTPRETDLDVEPSASTLHARAYPFELRIEVDVYGLTAPIVATQRIAAEADLPESAPLVVRAP